MPTKEFDVVIIGSGAGGGTVAKELSDLCAAGKTVALLEWGGEFTPRDNNRREIEMASKYYFDNGGFQTSTQDMTLAFAKALGGSTNVYTGVTFEVRQEALDKWGVDGLTLDDLQPRMQKYCQENNVHLQPPENINRNNELFRQSCESMGWNVGQFPLNLKGCAGLNTCNIGCARGAKQGTAQVQIPVAKANGVEIVTFCEVSTIAEGEVRATVRPPEYGLAPSVWEPGDYQIKARAIVIAAGAMNTTPILMRSFGENMSPALGRYFTAHPALTLVAQHDEAVNGTLGHPKSYFCEDFVEKDHYLLETCMYFPFVTSKNLSSFGPDVDSLLQRFDALQQILVLVLDEAQAENRITIDKDGKPVAHYNLDDGIRTALAKSVVASARIFFGAGATRMHVPGRKKFFAYADELDELVATYTADNVKLGQTAVSAAHLMGGARMGHDARSSVTDVWGRVHGLNGVYIADSSLFPGSPHVNPYLTIMAFADRVAEAVKSDLTA